MTSWYREKYSSVIRKNFPFSANIRILPWMIGWLDWREASLHCFFTQDLVSSCILCISVSLQCSYLSSQKWERPEGKRSMLGSR